MSFSAVDAFWHVVSILAMRSLPFAAYLAMSRALSSRLRLLVTTVYVAVIAIMPTALHHVFFWTSLGSGYYFIIACSVPLCTRALGARVVTPGALFVMYAVAYLLLPSVLLPQVASSTFLIIGWGLLLSSYSYCVDVSSQRPKVGDCLFFLLVNPTLTYSNRGRCNGPPRLQWRGLARVALGAGTMFLGSFFLRPVSRALSNWGTPAASLAQVVGVLVLVSGLRIATTYAAHSGLASIQIGFMNLVGHSIPERYNFPLLATSPLDFWRRWNTYVGSWLGKYIFIPGTRRFQHSFGARSKVVALILTFIVSGLLHDGYTYVSTFNATTKHLQLFAASAVTIVVWIGMERIRTKSDLSVRHAHRTLAGLAPRLVTLLLLALAASQWG